MPPLLILRFFRTIWGLLKDRDTRGVVYVVIALLAAGATFYHFVEGWRWLNSLYFSVITLTTVGYGDFSPKTDAGKIFTMIYILAGLGVLAGFISLLATKQQDSSRQLLNRRNQPPDIIPEQQDAPKDEPGSAAEK